MQVRRDWTRFTSDIPTDVSHYGRRESDWEVAYAVEQAISPNVDWRGSVVYAWRPPVAGLSQGDRLDEDEGAFHGTMVTSALSWHWTR